MPSSPMSLIESNGSQSTIDNLSSEVRWGTARDRDFSLGPPSMYSSLRELRFDIHSSGRASVSFISFKLIDFNLEKGEDKEEEEKGSEEVIAIVDCKAFKLTLDKFRLPSRCGNGGREVRLGQCAIDNLERCWNEGSDW